MKFICLALLLILAGCGKSLEQSKPHPAVEVGAKAVVAPAPEPPKRGRKGRKAKPPVPAVPVEQKEAMDTLEVETDTAEWVLGKTGIITVVIAEPALVPGEGGAPSLDIGIDSVPVSAYYLVALDGGQKGQFEILPAPGQQEKQHRAPSGYSAIWRYEVTPLQQGQIDLLFTLKVYSEGASAGTAISTRPFHMNVVSQFPKSHIFRLTHWVSRNGGWGPIIGLGAAGLTALAYSEWWRRKRKKSSHKKAETSQV